MRQGCVVGRGMVVALAILAAGVATAQGATLPDNRRAELVSPTLKNGGDVLANPSYTRAAANGDAVVFASFTPFADPLGTGVVTEYAAQRSSLADPQSNGWSTHAITPQQTSLPTRALLGGLQPSYSRLSDDLRHGVFRAWSPVTDDPMVADVTNLYVRSDILTPGPGSYALASGCPLCVDTSTPLPPLSATPFTGYPVVVGMSEDGRHVLFESLLRLTSDAVDGTSDRTVNLYVSDDGVVRLASVALDGRPLVGAIAGQGSAVGISGGNYTPHVLSHDGLRYVFTADPRPCGLGGSIHTCGTLFVRDRTSGTPVTVQVSGASPAIYWDASTDGSKIFFTTDEQLTPDDTNGNRDLYRFDLDAPVGQRLLRLSVQEPSLVSRPAGADVVLGVAEDGGAAYFAALHQLIAGESAIDDGAAGIFAWRETGAPGGELRYVGQLGPFSGTESKDVTSGQNYIGRPRESRVSADGRHFLFATVRGEGLLSAHGGADYDHGACNDLGIGTPGCNEIYVYDADADELRCATCRPDGQPATVSADFISGNSAGDAAPLPYLNHPLADGGRWVFFSTPEPLVPEDVNNRVDAYEWDGATGEIHLLSDGTDPGASYFVDASPSGDDVFIATRARLVGWDTDASYDLYDLRRPVPGHPAGFPDPVAAPVPCVGEACLGPSPGQPAAGTIGSLSLRSFGNVAPPRKARKPRRCRRGQVRRRVHGRLHCVKRPTRHARRARHAAKKGR
jgi:hypothetical protein